MSADRLSGAFFFLLGLALFFLIIPAYVEPNEDGSIAPNALPNIVSVVIGVGGLLLMIKPTSHQIQDLRYFARAGLFVAMLGGAVYAMSLFGFYAVAPFLALIMMLVIGERRAVVLVGGAVVMPAVIWFFITYVLDRSLGV